MFSKFFGKLLILFIRVAEKFMITKFFLNFSEVSNHFQNLMKIISYFLHFLVTLITLKFSKDIFEFSKIFYNTFQYSLTISLKFFPNFRKIVKIFHQSTWKVHDFRILSKMFSTFSKNFPNLIIILCFFTFSPNFHNSKISKITAEFLKFP